MDSGGAGRSGRLGRRRRGAGVIHPIAIVIIIIIISIVITTTIHEWLLAGIVFSARLLNFFPTSRLRRRTRRMPRRDCWPCARRSGTW